MPTIQQYEIVKQQVNSFQTLGLKSKLDITLQTEGVFPKIIIHSDKNKKSWRFSDPDWNILSRQLSTLFLTLKHEHQ